MGGGGGEVVREGGSEGVCGSEQMIHVHVINQGGMEGGREGKV